MLLASVETIRNALGFDSMTDINAAITAALNSAEPQLAVQLSTNFEQQTVTDVFWAKEPVEKTFPHVRTQFWFSQGFISSTPTVSAVQLRGGPFEWIDSTSDPFIIADGALVYNLEKGVATDWMTPYHHCRVTFTYQAGFPLDDTDESYDLTQVPAWLQEAAKLLTLIRLADSPIITEAGVRIDVPTIKLQLDSLLAKHTRYAPLALIPLTL
jgi:hypothetical protein